MRSILSNIHYGLFLLLASVQVVSASASDIEYGAELQYPDYSPQKMVFEFYYDEPQKIASALYWVRSVFMTLSDTPYNHAPDDLNIAIVIHGTEIVTLAKKNYTQYSEIVERLNYYSEFGVQIRVCAQAADTFGYKPADFPAFVTIVPSAIVDLIHWQSLGYALISPKITEKKFSLEEIR